MTTARLSSSRRAHHRRHYPNSVCILDGCPCAGFRGVVTVPVQRNKPWWLQPLVPQLRKPLLRINARTAGEIVADAFAEAQRSGPVMVGDFRRPLDARRIVKIVGAN